MKDSTKGLLALSILLAFGLALGLGLAQAPSGAEVGPIIFIRALGAAAFVGALFCFFLLCSWVLQIRDDIRKLRGE